MISKEDFDVVQEGGKFYPRAFDADHEIDAYGTFETEAAALEFVARWVDQDNHLSELFVESEEACNEN